ncbi:DNA-3-methyladenine glycosylase I [Rhodothalassium salexigens]|uniref:DNA-3-methyladenine glycosylase I n=1 Tax=Rhodothalassium salexigens TaxID=1086 RepID=UPI0019146FD5|nr:DNA-3-methyladenine glycosylase I [Rhodothalassium salexigens]
MDEAENRLMDKTEEGLRVGADGVCRCWWCGDAPDYQHYHDTEWGRPEGRDDRLFEKLVLEGFQAGLSWITVLRKRARFRRAFAGFDWQAMARFGEADVARLLADPGLIRHRGKIEAAINNARRMEDLLAETGSFARFVWQFEPVPERRPERVTYDAVKAGPPPREARAMAKALRARGWRFVGPVTVYSLFQAEGLVNDHLPGCPRRAEVAADRAAFTRPV